MDFFIDPPAVIQLTNRFDRAADDADFIGLNLTAQFRLAQILTPGVEVPPTVSRLQSLSESWVLAAEDLRDRVAKLEAAEITEAQLAQGDVIASIERTARARLFSQVREGVTERVNELLATNDPQVVLDNLEGEGDGSTPTIGELVADELEGLQSRDRPTSGPDAPDGEFVFPIFSIPIDGSDGNPTGLLDFIDQLADILPGGEFVADVLFAREIAEFFTEGEDGQGFFGNVRDLVAGAFNAVAGLFEGLFSDDGDTEGGGSTIEDSFGDDDGDGVPNSFDPAPDDPDVGLDEGEFGGTPTDPGAGTGGDDGTGDDGTGGDDGGGGDSGGGGSDNDNDDDGDRDGDGVPDGFDPDPDDPDVDDNGEGEFGGTPTDPGDDTDDGGGDDSGGDDGGGGDPTRVICTYFYQKGDLSRSDWVADLKFTRDRLSDQTVRGYHVWAIPTVRAMRSGSRFGSMIEPPMRWIARRRARELAYRMGKAERGDIAGKIVRFTFEPLCWVIGRFAKSQHPALEQLRSDHRARVLTTSAEEH